MNESALQAFINLVKFDQALVDLEQKVIKITESIKVREEELKARTAYMQSLEKNMQDLKKEVDSKELEMQDLTQAERKKRMKLEQISHSREVPLVYKELESIQKAQYDLEEVLLAAWQKLESAKNAFQLRKQSYDTECAALNAIIIQELLDIESIKKEITSLAAIRSQKTQNVPEKWLEKYAAMHSRVNNPVVPVLRGSCSACFYHILEQDLVRLKNRAVLECKDCYRFLYIE